MLHSVKGIVPLRLSGVSNVLLENIHIKNINNLGPFGSTICGNYKDGFSFLNSIPGYLGTDIRGITVESCTNVSFKNVLVE